MKIISSAGTIRIERITFTGVNGSDRIALACLVGGGYAVLRNAKVVGTWPADDVEGCVQTFIEMIDRRHSSTASAVGEDESGETPPPRRPQRRKTARRKAAPRRIALSA